MTTHADPTHGNEANLAPPPSPSDKTTGKIVCNACPVLCNITLGRSGACDRYANVAGVLTRVDSLILMQRDKVSPLDHPPLGSNSYPPPDTHPSHISRESQPSSSPTLPASSALSRAEYFVTGIGATTTYPDYKPAPFIVSSVHNGVDTVTVVTEGIFSYCSFKVKIDTDRYLGPEQAAVRYEGEVVGHVTTAEYGSQMLSLGGVHHLTGGSKREGKMSCQMMMELGNQQAVSLTIDEGSEIVVQAGHAPIVNGIREQRMRVGCGSATIGIFAPQWKGHVDEVIVVDDHITGVLTEHQAGRYIDIPHSGIRIKGKRSTPGRYFQVSKPGLGWGGTEITNPLDIIDSIDLKIARAGLRLLFVSTTGEDSAYFILDESLKPQPAEMPLPVQAVVNRIAENCEPSLCTVLFLGGAGGSLRAGVTENPILLTRAIKNRLTNVTCGGAPAYIWPGGGIMVMVDVSRMPALSFGYVPTPAIVAPVEFTMRIEDYHALGGHLGSVRSIEEVIRGQHQLLPQSPHNPWPIGTPPLLG